jgi:hypothetical protein
MSNSTTIRAVETEFLHANKWTEKRTEGWTDVKKLAIALRNFANALTNNGKLLINYNNPIFMIEVLYYRALAFYCFFPLALQPIVGLYFAAL